jgi:hypothetical protein
MIKLEGKFFRIEVRSVGKPKAPGTPSYYRAVVSPLRGTETRQSVLAASPLAATATLIAAMQSELYEFQDEVSIRLATHHKRRTRSKAGDVPPRDL